METEQITIDQLVEVAKILNKVDIEEKDLIMNHIIKLNNAVRDYENVIKNAISTLQR